MSKRVKLRPVSPVQYDFYKRRMPELAEAYPLLFDKRFPEPLALGITDILVEETYFTRHEISQLLYVWCGRHEYLMMMCSCEHRSTTDMLLSEKISEEHRQGYYKRVNGLHPNAIRRWVRDFETLYEMEPFLFMPDEHNPIKKEGFKRIEPMKYQAKLSTAFIHKLKNGRWYMTGRVWEDTSTDGDHPFRDGQNISTSSVKSISEKLDTFFVKTKNTTYRIIGNIVVVCDDDNFTIQQVKDELAGQASEQLQNVVSAPSDLDSGISV